MTTNNDRNDRDRLDRLEAIVASNARAIQSLLDARAEERLESQERLSQFEERISRLEDIAERLTKVSEGIAHLVSALDDERPTILRKLTAIEKKVDRLLEQNS